MGRWLWFARARLLPCWPLPRWPTRPTPRAPPSADEAALLELANAHRKAAGLPALRTNPKLMEAARGHATNMAKKDNASLLDGRDVGGLAKAAGYRYRTVYGLPADGPETPKAAVGEWLEDSTSRRHLNAKFLVDAGVGVATNAKGVRYWYLVLAEPADD